MQQRNAGLGVCRAQNLAMESSNVQRSIPVRKLN